MAGPWEKFQSAESDGPWAKFGDSSPAVEQPKARLDAVSEPNWFEQQLAKITLPESANWGLNRARGFVMGAADPVVGGVQLLANAVNNFTKSPTLSSLVTGEKNGWGDKVNKAIAEKEKQYQDERKSVGADGVDLARFSGNVASPVNLIAAAKIPMASTIGGRVAQGAGLGAVGGAMEPITDTSKSDYAEQKAAQIGLGAAFGGVAAPVLGKLGDAVVRRMNLVDPEVAGARASMETDNILKTALQDIGQTVNDLPPNTVQYLREQVSGALKQGKKLDPAAMLRAQDFKDAGVKPLLGQVTRDPMQFAKEQNLRGVANVGEPISNVLSEQNRVLQSGIGRLREAGSQPAAESFSAGDQLVKALQGTDEKLSGVVRDLYKKARQSAGKDLDVPLQGMAQDLANVVHEFADKVPAGVLNRFREFGLDPLKPGNQTKVFTIEEADKLLKTINSHVGSDNATNVALGRLRESVKNAVTSADSTGGPFAPAVKAAAERFKLHEAVPSLKAAAEGTVAPDDFVRRYVVNGKTNDVKGMAQLLSITDKEAYDQARAQIGTHLYRSAFGEDVAGTKGFAAERFNKSIRELGSEKLNAFFSADEVAQIRRLGRVGAYIHQEPAAAAVNRSNTASATLNLLGKVPGAPALLSVASAAKGAVDNSRTVRNALAASPVPGKADLSPEQLNVLAKIMAGGGLAAGGLAGSAFR